MGFPPEHRVWGGFHTKPHRTSAQGRQAQETV
jgi:hypothetical protein